MVCLISDKFTKLNEECDARGDKNCIKKNHPLTGGFFI